VNRSRGDAGWRQAGNGPARRLAAVPAAAVRASDADEIDEALDDLVTTVDDLVHDLGGPAGSYPALGPVVEVEPVRRRAAAPTPVHGKAFTAAVILVLILFEFLVLAWLLSNP
jgi:hypothetical protein